MWTGGHCRLAAAVAEELEGGEQQGEEAGGKAAHREHQREPAEVGVRALSAVMPPKLVKISAAAMTPVPKMRRPVRRSLRVSGCIGNSGLGRRLAVGSEHRVDDDSADRNVEPDGVGPAREFLVCGEASGEREEEGDEDHRQADDGEKNVRRQQDPEVDEAGGGVGLGEEHVAVEDVVGDVGDEKDARDDEGAEHAVAVFDDLATTNVAEADDEEDGAERVEDGVERWKKGEVRAGDVDRRMVVDQPGEEERCDCADADDRGDDRGRRAVGSWAAAS